MAKINSSSMLSFEELPEELDQEHMREFMQATENCFVLLPGKKTNKASLS